MKQSKQALAGVRVLEFAEGVSGPYCSKIMADLGAEVIKIEPPGRGDISRQVGPFWKNEPHPEKSGLFIYLNSNKQSVTLNPAESEGKELFFDLISTTDILVEANLPKRMKELGITYDILKEINPRLIMVSITPFGQSGPYSDFKAYNLNICHGSGESSILQSIDMGREPLKVGGYAEDFDSGMTAGVAALGAYYSREFSEEGVHLDISQQEVLISLGRVDQVKYTNDGVIMSRDMQTVVMGGDMKCKDGYVNVIAIQDKQWQGFMKLMGNPEWGQGDSCKDEIARAENSQILNKKINDWIRDRGKEEIFHMAQKNGVPITAVYDVKDIVNSSQTKARALLQEFEQPLLGKIYMPQGPYRFSETPWKINRPAPKLGEYNEKIIPKRKMFENSSSAKSGQNINTGNQKLNLKDVRILDFTWAWAGPFGTLLLGFMGAEVLKVESAGRLDHSRIRSLAAGPNYEGPNKAGPFNDLNLNKKSITLNLSDQRGIELVKKLIPQCDVVVNNFRPGIMDRWGLGYDELKKIKPDIIMLSSSACGGVGPEKEYIGYAPSFCALGGISHLTGFADRGPIGIGGRIDTSSGTATAFAILSALIYRKRTGRGQYIDFSSREGVSTLVGDAIMDYQFTGNISTRIGNGSKYTAPHNAYRCKGADAWISIAVITDREWESLCEAMNTPELKTDPRFKNAETRVKNQTVLDDIISGWTADKDYYEIMNILQSRGVASLPTFNSKTILENEHIQARKIFVKVKPPEMGERTVVRAPWLIENSNDESIQSPAPLLGEHNDYVFGDLLKMTAEEIEKLIKEKILY